MKEQEQRRDEQIICKAGRYRMHEAVRKWEAGMGRDERERGSEGMLKQGGRRDEARLEEERDVPLCNGKSRDRRENKKGQ
jgi:hypothetical protein